MCTSADMWAGMQMQYDLYQAGKVKRPKIERLAARCEIIEYPRTTSRKQKITFH